MPSMETYSDMSGMVKDGADSRPFDDQIERG